MRFTGGVAPRLRGEAETIYDLLKGFESRLEACGDKSGESIFDILGGGKIMAKMTDGMNSTQVKHPWNALN
jgi:hypothetical protein